MRMVVCRFVLCQIELRSVTLTPHKILNTEYNLLTPFPYPKHSLVVGFVVLILVGLVPGYFVSVLTIDCIGRRILQVRTYAYIYVLTFPYNFYN